MHAYSTKHYVVNKITGNISAIHDDSIEPTDFFGYFGPFNLKELEFDVYRIADCHNNAKVTQGWMMTGGRQQQMLQPCYSQPNPGCCDHSMN